MNSTNASTTFREQTLSTRYHPRQQLPPNFPEILKEYAREVLRAQPENILDWSAQYFKVLALATDPLQAQRPPPDHFVPVVENQQQELLTQQVLRLCARADEEGRKSLPTVLVQQLLCEAFKLTPTQALYILTSEQNEFADDGSLIYDSLASHAAPELEFFLQSGQDFEVDDLTDATVHGLNRHDVELEFLRIFRLMDESNSGKVKFPDFRNAIMNAPFNLTQRDINLLCAGCDRSKDGEDTVDYEKEVKDMFDLLALANVYHQFDDETEHRSEDQ